MTPLELAERYMDAYYNTGDIDALAGILHPQFCFEGPLYRCDSAADYIAAMRRSPPQGLRYQLLHASASEDAACLVYRFSKHGRQTMMAQLFEVRDDAITRINLIFNPADIL